MSEFIREVDDEYRRDQIARIWQRYNGLIIGCAILVLAAVGGWRYWQHAQQVRSEEAAGRYEEALRLSRDGKSEDSEKSLAALAADAPVGYRLLARFRLAAETGRRSAQEGAAAYDALAADSAIEPSLQDLARLRAAMLRMDGPDPAPAQAALERLAAPTNAWRHTAREMLGLLGLKRGDDALASRYFDQIAADPESPQSLRGRLQVYTALAAGGPVQTTQ